MKVLVIPVDKAQEYQSKFNTDDFRFEIVKDRDGNIIMGKEILEDECFKSIWPELNEFNEIDYKPILMDEV